MTITNSARWVIREPLRGGEVEGEFFLFPGIPVWDTCIRSYPGKCTEKYTDRSWKTRHRLLDPS